MVNSGGYAVVKALLGAMFAKKPDSFETDISQVENALGCFVIRMILTDEKGGQVRISSPHVWDDLSDTFVASEN